MTIFITGGTKGIGLAIAERLAGPDVELVLAYRSDEAAAAAAVEHLKPTRAKVITVRTDIGTVEGAVRVIAAGSGNAPAHIVHCAAMCPSSEHLALMAA